MQCTFTSSTTRSWCSWIRAAVKNHTSVPWRVTRIHTYTYTQIYVVPKIVRTNLRRWHGITRRYAAAKSVLTSPITNMKFLASELRPCVDKFCLDEWQDIWDCCRGNKLHAIYPTVGTATHIKHSSQSDSVLLNRLWIGHCRITHSHLLSRDAHTSWGTDQYTLVLLYTSLIRSKLDYDCIVYGSARSSYLRMLDPVQNHALRPVSYTHLTLPTTPYV